MKAIVSIKEMYKSFFGVIAMDGMNFSMEEGEVRCLIGENGCGKSTMIKVISGFYEYDAGHLEINGVPRRKLTPTESMREGIQVIYQDFSLFFNMTIAENIMMYDSVGSGKKLVHWKRMRQRAVDTLKKIRFDIDPDRYVHTLSVAEKQMVAICRAIVQDARMIVMDEPTTALTHHEVAKLFDVVKELKRHGVAVLFVSHKLDEVLEICDSITVMRNGKNVYESQADNGVPSKAELIRLMTGRELMERSFRFVPEEGEAPLMQVEQYTRAGCFQQVDFSLFRGEILGITGLLGCGREELAEALFGIVAADSGNIRIDGEDLGVFRRVQDALAQEIAYLPEDRLTKGLHLDHSIADNSVSRVIGRFVRRGFLDKKGVSKQKRTCLSSIHIAGMRPENPVKSLSGGNQQKVVLVKWLASNPRILILNCPTVGVDVGAKAEIHEMVQDLARQGLGTVVISDDIPEIMQLCNRVLIMKAGRISEEIQVADTTMEALEARLALGKEREEHEAVCPYQPICAVGPVFGGIPPFRAH